MYHKKKKEVITIPTETKNSLLVGQVITVYKERYLLEYEEIRIMAEVSGRFKFTNYEKSAFPVIGDYVYFHKADDYLGIIESIQTRKSALERLDVGKIREKQILAANIDICFISMSCNKDFNLKKLRDFLTLTYGGNFETIILLTKKDLTDNPDYYINQVKAITDNNIYAISAYELSDMDLVKSLNKDKTACLIGASGVGKSTIINKLIGEEHFETKNIRVSDAQGRHTTVNRELIHLDNGGKIIDTPGIRIVTSYFSDTEGFEDIMLLSEGCRYSDCKHEREPGCMVKKALYSGELDYERYEQYKKAERVSRFNQKRELERARMLDRRLKKSR
jgi:ribosome biogenesis GTPase